MARIIRDNRRGRTMNVSLSSAFDVGIQLDQNRNSAIFVTSPNRKKFTLVTKEGKTTDTGQCW